MLKKSIPQHKRMAMGGGHTPLGYAKGGMVAAGPSVTTVGGPATGGGMMSPGGPSRSTARESAPMSPVRAAPGRQAPLAAVSRPAPMAPIRSPMTPVRNPTVSMGKPAPVGPMTTGVAMKSGGGVKGVGASANAVKQPLTTARTNNGLKGMKSGGTAGKKC